MTIEQIQADQFLMRLVEGKYDGQLQMIQNTVANRLKFLTPKINGINIRDARVGQRVKFNERVRPAYLRGAFGTITKVNRERVKLVLDDPTGRFGTKPINTPVAILNFA